MEHKHVGTDQMVKEERLSLVIEAAQLGIWDWNIEQNQLFWSERSLQMFGITAEQMNNYDDFLSAVHPEDREPIDRAVKTALENKSRYDVEMRAVWPDGSVHWVASRGRAFYDESGRPVRMSGIAIDISRRKQIEEELAKARAQATAEADNLAAVLDAIPAATFFSSDSLCRKIVSNRAAYEMLKMPYGSNTSKSAPEGERSNIRIFENGKELADEELPMQRAAATGQPVRNKELEIRVPDGSSLYYYGHSVPLFNEHGQVRGAVGAFLNVSERKRILEELHVARERFELALRSTPITVFSMGRDLRYKWVYNPVGGHSAAELIGKRDTEVLERPEDAAMLEEIKSEVLRTGASYQGEMTIQMKGMPCTYHLNMEPTRDAQGQIIGLTCACFDLTERKRTLAERERLARQKQLALTAAHMGWWQYDPAKNVGSWDDAFKEIFGIARNSGSAEDFLAFVHPDDLPRTWAKFLEAVDSDAPEPFYLEYRVARPDGSVRWVEAYGASEFEGEGPARRVVGCVGTVRDITERKATEKAVRESEARLRELAANLDQEVQVRTRELEERNEEVQRSAEGLRRLSNRLLQIQDEERRRIARELHDSAGQLLTALGLELAGLQSEFGKIAPELAVQLEVSQRLLEQLHQEVRTTSYLLHPPLLDEAGLYSAVSWYVQGLAHRSGLEIQLHVAENFGRLPCDMELVVFRLVQESLTNIHRHSGSKTAMIRIARNDGAVVIEVKDQGRGMSPQEIERMRKGGSGVGIRGMRERLGQFNGELRIDSGPSGTQVFVTIPIPKSATEEDGLQSLPAAV